MTLIVATATWSHMQFKSVLVLAIAALGVGSQAAGLYNYNLDNPQNATTGQTRFVNTGIGQNVTINNGSNMNVFAGQMNNTFAGTTYAMMCVEIEQHANGNNSTYTREELNGQLGWLINQMNTGLTNAQAAGLQVAIWETVYDHTGAGEFVYSLDAGNFKLVTTGDVRTEAQGWLTMVGESNLGGYFHFTNQANQDYIMANPVPEPATMLGLGAAVSMMIARRRKK